MYKMKKITLLISGLVLSTIVSTTSAQQLPNNGFEKWEAAGNTYQSNKSERKGGAYGDIARPDTEPVSWNGSSVHQIVYYLGTQEKKATLVTQGTDNSNYAILTNKFVGLGSIGSTAPGFLSLATPWVFAYANMSNSEILKNSDGGVFGGMEFTYRPDAVVGKFKRTDSNTENSHIIAYIWDGTFVSNIKSDTKNDAKNDVDRAVLSSTSGLFEDSSKPTCSSTGTLVAYCDYKFSSTNSAWQTIEVPLTYVNTSVVPQKINVILSAADYWTRGNIQENTSLCVDDVKLLYYSRLESLSVGGYNIPLEPEKYDYYIYDTNLSGYTATKLGEAELKDVTADNNSTDGIFTVTVTNKNDHEDATDYDGKRSHSYRVHYLAHTTGHASVFKNGASIAGPTEIQVDYMKEADGTYALTFSDDNGNFEYDDVATRTPSRTLITGVTMTVDSDGCYVFTKDGATQGRDYTVSLVNDGATKCIYDPNSRRWIFNFDVNYDGNVTRVTVTSDVTLSGVNGMNSMKERVVARSGAIEVSGFDGVAEVYTIDGRLVAKTVVAGNAQIAASNGIYLVRTPNTVKKVIVR